MVRPDLDQGVLVISLLNSQQLLWLDVLGVGKQGVHFKSRSQEVIFVVFKGMFEELSQHDPIEAVIYEMPPGKNNIVMVFVLIVKFIEEVKKGFKITYFLFGQLLVLIIQVFFCEATTLNDCKGKIDGID